MNDDELAFGTAQWIAWIGIMVAAAASIVVFAYNSFETKEHSKERIEDVQSTFGSIERRLERIETKLDQMLEGRHK